jgi:quinoprotein glucose dehydrogenase
MHIRIAPAITTIVFFMVLCACHPGKNNDTPWPAYNGATANIHYSTLTDIDTDNVAQLKPAWVLHTGDADTVNHSQIQCNPLIIDGMLYGVSPKMKLFAADAATGQQQWVFNPFDSLTGNQRLFFILNNCRGISYWTDGDNDKRIFYTAGSLLYCVNAVTGRLAPSFGSNGKIDLHDGLDMDAAKLFVTATSPGVIYKDLIIMGTRVDETAGAAPGHIRAFDVRTGRRRWIFHTIPRPGEPGYNTWDDTAAYRHTGGANAWSGLSLDEKTGIVFAATGSATYDFYGAKRTGSNLFSDCVLALDAATGKYIWHFQEVHHDLWDRDLPSPPALITITKAGKTIDAVAQTTKTGMVFVLNRATGKPIFPVEEKPVPPVSELAGEKPWPSQPMPTLPAPFVRQSFTEADINPLLPDSSQRDIKNRLAGYKTGNMFNPPSREGTVIFPGYDGGSEWGGPAYDPTTSLLYVNASEMAWVLTMVDVKTAAAGQETNGQAGLRLYRANCMGCHGVHREGSGNNPSLTGIGKKYPEDQFLQLITTGRRMMPSFKQLGESERRAIAAFVLGNHAAQQQKFTAPATPADVYTKLPYTGTGYNRFLSREGYPAVRPPWGTLNAINLGTGALEWRDTLGDNPVFAARGIHTGTENYGGCVVTAGGLVFIAATSDARLRAYNKRSGQLLWQTTLPAAGFATPAVYAVYGRQYLVIACGGGKLGAPSGDSYMAFSLP